MRALAPQDEGNLIASIAVTPPGGTTPPYAAGGGKRTANENQALVAVGISAAYASLAPELIASRPVSWLKTALKRAFSAVFLKY